MGRPDGDRVLTSMPIGFMAISRGWTITHVNPAAERLLLVEATDLVGRDFWEVYPDNLHNEFGRAYRAAMDDRITTTVEAFYPDPLNRWYRAEAVPTDDGVHLYFSDVSDRRVAQDRLGLLARVGTELAGTLDVAAAVARIPQLVVPGLADGCLLTVLDEDGRPRDVGSWHVDPAARGLIERYAAVRLADLPPTAPLLRALRDGETVSFSGAQALATLPEGGESRRLLLGVGVGHAVTLPLRGHARVVGALTLLLSRTEPPSEGSLLTARQVADRIGVALDNARLFDQQRQLAEGLQRSLLTAPVQPDYAEIVVRYTPAAESARVGGDWYDAFVQPSGATMLVIGDVAGHDTEAAAAMGQLRSLLRGIATYSDGPPAEVLRGLDGAMSQLQVGTFATAAIARFEQAGSEDGVTRMRWSNAGHLPLLVIHPDGTLGEIGRWQGDLLLGVDPDAVREESVVELRPGATVFMFTDGLIERRSSDLDVGMARLRAVALELADRPLAELCDEIIERLVQGRPEDDVALVAIRLHRRPGPRD